MGNIPVLELNKSYGSWAAQWLAEKYYLQEEKENLSWDF